MTSPAVRRALPLLLALLAGCGTFVRGQDSSVDGPRDRTGPSDTNELVDQARLDAPGVVEMLDVAERADLEADAGADSRTEVVVAADAHAVATPDAHLCTQPTTTPPNVGRSCAAGTGVDPELCRGVFYCGGTFSMGTTSGRELRAANGTLDNSAIEICEVHSVTVHDGFVDAYEVTVARFRQWINAGRPHPTLGTKCLNGFVWSASEEAALGTAETSNENG